MQVTASAGSALREHEALMARPVATIRRLAKVTGLSVPTVSRSLKGLTDLGIVFEVTGGKYRRIYAYRDYIRALNEGTEAA